MRRETAVELPVTPSKSAVASGGGGGAATDIDPYDRNMLASKPQHQSADQSSTVTRLVTSTNYLTPSMSEPQPRPYKNSTESLRKNSSTDTEYSLQPYKVIKQSSNETNPSFTGSSFNVDTSANADDGSLENETMQTTINSSSATVIECGASSTTATTEDRPVVAVAAAAAAVTATAAATPAGKVTTFGGVEIRPNVDFSVRAAAAFFKKQFSVDHHQSKSDDKSQTVQKSCLKPPAIATQQQQQHSLSMATTTTTAGRLSGTLQESSSLSTDESKDDRTIPKISTTLVQDEIAKLSSNIKSSTEEEKTAPPYNETMC